MRVKIKKLHPNAVIPKYAKSGDAGLDLTAGLLFPRSSVYKTHQMLSNCVGVIDSGYRGEIMMKFTRSRDQYVIGSKIGQLIIMPYPHIEFEEVDQLSDTERGTGGYGSTGS